MPDFDATGNLYDPTVRHLYGLQCWIALLVILGGIGFPILFNFGRLFNYHFRNAVNRIKRNPSTYNRQLHIISLTTRIVIPMTLILVIGGTCLFLGLEYNNTLKDLPFSGKLAISFMSAVTPRTAGFSSIDMASPFTSDNLRHYASDVDRSLSDVNRWRY